MRKAIYFAVTDESYPRNRRIRSYLANEAGYELVVEAIDASRGYARNAFHLAGVLFRNTADVDVVILAEFSLQYAWIAWLVARKSRALLVVDWFVGLHETRILDYAPERAGSPSARVWQAIDRFAVKVADLLITDTEMRARMLQTELGAKALPIAIPVGAPDWARPDHTAVAVRHANSPLRILYYGNYIPLHGLPNVIRAIGLLPEELDVRLTLVGGGRDRAEAEQLVENLGLSDVFTFVEPVGENDLLGIIRQHHVVLGIFGSSPKALSVIANKVWQGLAAGAVVVTQKSEALRKLRPLAGDLLQESTGGTPSAIAAILQEIYGGEIDAPSQARRRTDRALERYATAQLSNFAETLDRLRH
ncbi:glycosyltransferase [Lacisediminihabitans sp.]|uniref:glycosyltransferase n=1 Tax=Lacisediminihabitans sp. TaxID=2787631 RepID=UPI00374D7336